MQLIRRAILLILKNKKKALKIFFSSLNDFQEKTDANAQKNEQKMSKKEEQRRLKEQQRLRKNQKIKRC